MRVHPFLVLIPMLWACVPSSEDANSQSSGLFTRDLDYAPAERLQLNEEYLPPQERTYLLQATERFRIIHRQQQQANSRKAGDQTSVIWRGMHAKAHGCLQGTFTVTREDADLAFGVFKRQNVSYSVVARFSNGSGLLQSDQEADLHGLAIKIYGSEGPFMNDAPELGVQDLLMTSAPVHHARDIVQLMDFTEAFAAGGITKAWFLLRNPLLTMTLLRQVRQKPSSVSSISYWSRAVYRLGPHQMIKYRATPCIVPDPEQAQHHDDHYLSQELDRHATENWICFSISVQKQLHPQSEPVENYQVEWKTPSLPVARVEFEPQTPDRSQTCERLVFNPWNASQDMEPVGNFNRARRYIYKAAAEFRRLDSSPD